MRARSDTAMQAPAQDWRSRALVGLVLAAILFNFALCFVNTNLFRTGAGVVIGCEVALIGMTLALVPRLVLLLFIGWIIGLTEPMFELFGHAVIAVSSTTPIEDERCLQRFTFYTDGSDVAAKIAPAFAAEVERQFDQDIPIWESKAYVAVPALAPNEKPVTEFRKWAAQFYVEA